MGIQGLLPLLKSVMVPVHIKELDGCSVAVDTYSWLHKGALSCSTQLCKGEPTTRYIDYCMHRVNLLRHYGVKPVLVFDGGLLPMKSEQENKRARARKENLARALEHESNGNSSAAFECYQKAVDISPVIAYELIQALKKDNISYIVAPYEADAQMTFLAVSHQVDAVITEDSDLIPFGCPRIIFKMDKFGQAVQFRSSMIQQNKELSLIGFSNQMILEMCILSGCDYLQSLPGMGLKRAHALIKKFKSHDKVIKHLQYSGVSVSPLYVESFRKAIWTFRHQLVYNPTVEDVVHLTTPCDEIGNNLDFLGPVIPQDIAKGIARGELDPFTKLPFQGETVNAKADPSDTYQLKMFKPEIVRKKLELPVQRNLLTNYFCFASLEAKRKFTAPQTTAGSPNIMESSSPIPREDTKGGSSACKTAYKPDQETSNSLPSEDSVEDGDMFKLPEFSGCPNIEGSDNMRDVGNFIKGHGSPHQPSQYLHKPCLALREERELMYSLEAVESKTNLNVKKISSKSSYFQHKLANENDGNDTKAIESLKDAAASDVTPEDSCKERSSKGPLLKRKIAHANIIQTIENGKVIRRSSYFQQKAVNKMDYNNKNEMFSAKNDTSDSCQNTILESPSPEQSIGGLYSKTQAPPMYHMETEKEVYKENVPLPSEGGSGSDLDKLDVKTKFEEEKFGSNISHLDRYSDIAEKSVENFVSMISSFRHSSSGSRASGLRAPLKDVRDTCINRSSAAKAIGEFSYVPKKQKTNPIFHRS